MGQSIIWCVDRFQITARGTQLTFQIKFFGELSEWTMGNGGFRLTGQSVKNSFVSSGNRNGSLTRLNLLRPGCRRRSGIWSMPG